jgi:hypothetical protein
MTGLLGSTVLEVAIGIAFVYLLLAIFCTTINEWLAGILKTRGKLLKQGILQLLAPDARDSKTAETNPIVSLFYQHPLVKGMIRDAAHPSYLPARTFAKVIMDLATPNHPGSIDFNQLEAGIKNDLPDGSLKKSLLAAIQGVDANIQEAQKAIEAWYDDAMDRVSGWYKRKTQVWTVVVALIITIGTNADTVHIARQLWIEPAIRGQIVEAAKNPPNPAASGAQTTASAAGDTNVILGRVIGWRSNDFSVGILTWLQRILGWILTVIAVSLGAPFWFDVLNKFMNLRSAGKSPEEKGKPPMKPKMPPVNP